MDRGPLQSDQFGRVRAIRVRVVDTSRVAEGTVPRNNPGHGEINSSRGSRIKKRGQPVEPEMLQNSLFGRVRRVLSLLIGDQAPAARVDPAHARTRIVYEITSDVCLDLGRISCRGKLVQHRQTSGTEFLAGCGEKPHQIHGLEPGIRLIIRKNCGILTKVLGLLWVSHPYFPPLGMMACIQLAWWSAAF